MVLLYSLREYYFREQQGQKYIPHDTRRRQYENPEGFFGPVSIMQRCAKELDTILFDINSTSVPFRFYNLRKWYSRTLCTGVPFSGQQLEKIYTLLRDKGSI
jgi:hypothetical protein